MKFKIVLFIIISVLIVILASLIFLVLQNLKTATINSFEDCKVAGYPILEIYPEQCKVPDGRTFVRIIAIKEVPFNSAITLQINENVKFSDGLSVTLLEINDSRCKPGVVCVWAGEFSPVFALVSGNVGEIQQEIRLGDSTAKQLVQNNYIFLLNNATENTATITVTNSSACYIGGCSSQICSDKEDAVSTCEYRNEYACYKNAECSRQSNGQCGWTQTVKLKACLSGETF